MMEYNHESENNIEIQGKILMSLTDPMTLKGLIKKMRLDHRIRKNDVLRNVNYLTVHKMALVRRHDLLYLEQDDPGKYIRKHGGKGG